MLRSPIQRLPLILLLWAVGATPGLAQQDGDCASLDWPQQGVAQSRRVVSDLPRTYFVKSRSDAADCPAAATHCQRRAYLVPGDEVITTGDRNGFVCAGYVSAGGRLTVGWLPAAALRPQPVRSGTAADWSGQWKRDDEAGLDIRAVDHGAVEISGTASWGGHDPERVARGGVNVGEIEATVVPLDGQVLRLEPGVGVVAAGHDDEFACIVELQRVGQQLMVRDNLRCGGMNVSFSGLYLRKAAAPR